MSQPYGIMSQPYGTVIRYVILDILRENANKMEVIFPRPYNNNSALGCSDPIFLHITCGHPFGLTDFGKDRHLRFRDQNFPNLEDKFPMSTTEHLRVYNENLNEISIREWTRIKT